MYNQEQYLEDANFLERRRLDIYEKETENANNNRLASLKFNKKNAEQYDKMVFLVFIQTLIAVTQTLLFAGIYFKL